MTDAAYLLVHGDREYLLSPGEEFGTDLGVIEVPADVEAGDTVETHLGTVFEVRELRGPDLFDHLERTGAPMMPRDVGLVMGHTGVSAGDRVLDAGTGSGILSVYLGRAGAAVTTYEIDADFADVARRNTETAGVAERVDVRTGDVVDELDDLAAGEPFDVLTLDTGDAPDAVARAPDLLVSGGFLAAYSPFVEGTREIVTAARDAGLVGIEAIETIQREMDFSDRGSRPSTAGVGHTGYLVFARAP
ncbi:methyltransferase domain-containing protein [Halorubrum sp. JWXQ-INN 858]|uniref:tRNA (adenine-N1)-methyltransferase n=1 Tax=Halorubrum sp. JWXQ-INN 858 TaxID=2690782 RepID=UPI0013FB6EB7|nr:tRNA (adenine-N1)-methyltransferase [Halorubrum sp. JWXQ-INN 858]MWV64967.1 methyltransferase domain-containing protein [Halorubrum sp. JWXQ-INN 858]